jgi:hypothetical protein
VQRYELGEVGPEAMLLGKVLHLSDLDGRGSFVCHDKANGLGLLLALQAVAAGHR